MISKKIERERESYRDLDGACHQLNEEILSLGSVLHRSNVEGGGKLCRI